MPQAWPLRIRRSRSHGRPTSQPAAVVLTGLRPSPTSHASLGPVSGQAHAGTHGQSARPPPPARRWMVTVTRSAYEQDRCVVMALWSEWLPRYAAEDDP